MSKKMQRLFSLMCVAAMLFSFTSFSEEELPGGAASETYAEVSEPEETYAEPAWEEPVQDESSDEQDEEMPAEELAQEDPSEGQDEEMPVEEPSQDEPSGEEQGSEPGADEPSGEEQGSEPGADESAGEASVQKTSPVNVDIQVSVNQNTAESVRIQQYPGCSVVRLLVGQSQHLNLVLEADMDFVVSRVYEPEYSAYSDPNYRYSENSRLVIKFDAQAGSYLLFVYAAEYSRTGTLNIRLLDDGWYAMYSAASRRPKTPDPAEETAPAEDDADSREQTPAENAAPAAEDDSTKETAPTEEAAGEDQPDQAQGPASGEESAAGPAAEDESGTEEAPAPADEQTPTQESASGEEPADVSAAEDESGTEEAPAPADEQTPAQEPASGEEPADGSAAGDESGTEAETAPADEQASAQEPASETTAEEEPAAQISVREPSVNPADLYVGFTITWDDEVPSFGSVAHLDAVLDGFENLDFSFQWQYSEDNSSWTDVEGETQRRMDTVITEQNYLYYWRVMVYINVPAEG